MQAIKNTGLLTICNVCGLSGFLPGASYVYNSGAATIVVTEASTFAAGDGLKIMHIYITDADGNIEYYTRTVAGTNHSFDVSTMNPVHGFTINVTIVTNNRMVGDLSAYNVGSGAPTTGTLAYGNKSQQ